MCNFRIADYSNSAFKPVSARKLICVSSGQPIAVRLLYGMFCDKLCDLEEARAMFEQYRMGGLGLDKMYGSGGCDSNNKNDNPREPTYIKTHNPPPGGHYFIR